MSTTEVSDRCVDTETTCAVCLDEYKHRTGVFYLNSCKSIKVCSHEFCQECIVGWLRSNLTKTCPLCRRSVILNNNHSSDYESSSDELSIDDIYIQTD